MTDELLLRLVESGKSVRSIKQATGLGYMYILKRLKKLGIVPKDTTVQDCITKVPVEETVRYKNMKIFTYDDFLTKVIGEGASLGEINKIYNFGHYEGLHAYKKYQTRYKTQTTL